MTTYAEFKKIIDLQIAHSKRLDKLHDLGIDFIELFSNQDTIIHLLWGQILTEHGEDWLNWYLYEKDGISGKPKKDMTADDNGKVICKDLKGTYNYLMENKYFKN